MNQARFYVGAGGANLDLYAPNILVAALLKLQGETTLVTRFA